MSTCLVRGIAVTLALVSAPYLFAAEQTSTILGSPDISVTPPSFSESLLSGESVTRTLTIENTGGSDLQYEISIRPGDGSVSMSPRAFATFGSAPPRILVYADDAASSPGNHYVERALQTLGLSYVAYYSNPQGFGTALTGASWDLVIVDNNHTSLGPWWGALENYLLADGRALISTYNIDGSDAPPTGLWTTLGIAPAGDIGAPPAVYRWDPVHRLFNVPEAVPDFTQLVNSYLDHGDLMSVTSPSRAVAGFSSSPEAGYGAIVVAGYLRAIVNSFLLVENQSDLDGDGKPDAVELLENEIAYLLVPAWLSASPVSGVVPAGGSVEVSVTFDATGLYGADYDAQVVVTSNDPDAPELSVPAHLHVTGAPDIDVTSTALDFGSLFVGASATRTISVANVGTDVLTVTSVAIDQGEFSVDASNFTLGAGATRSVTVTYAPSAPGPVEATLTVQSDDPDEPQLTVSLRGEGLVAPDVSVTPSSFSESLFVGESVARTLTIENTGGSELPYEISYPLGPPWLSVSPVSGVIPAGGRVEASVTFTAVVNGGDYDAQVVVTSNDPDEPKVLVPAHLHVTGVPDIFVASTEFDFGSLFVGASTTRVISFANVGTDVLTVTSVATDQGDFSADVSSFTLAVGETRNVTVTFAPSAPGLVQATLTLQSDDPGEPELAVSLRGDGLIAPDISVTPESLSESLLTGESVTRTLTIENIGGSDLIWQVAVGAGASLENVLARLDASYASITVAIPNRFDFFDGEVGNQISDGGFDMYDGGNYLNTDLGVGISYSNGSIASSSSFGPGGRYFTRKYPGLFLLVADMEGVGEFFVSGDLGADGAGNANGTTLERQAGGVNYLGFVKRVFNAGDPSVNHLVIVEERPGLVHTFPTYTNDDFDQISGLAGSTRLYYLLYAGDGGSYIDDGATQKIMHAFLDVLGPRWLSASPTEGVVPAGGAAAAQLTFDATGLNGGDYDAQFVVTSNDPDEPEVVSAHLHVTGAPDIDVTPTALDFGSVFVGASATRTVSVANVGTDVLTVTSIAIDQGDFSADASSFTLAVGETRNVTVTFAPSALGLAQATLTLQSDDPDEPQLTVSLGGEGLIPPDISVTPSSFSESLFTGESVTRTLTIENTGGSNLTWQVSAGGASSLEDVLARLDASYASITVAIPNRFDFFEGEVGNQISDGGFDMYDGGNYLNTELGGGISYSNGSIASSSSFGPGGRYFTRKYPGLFLLVADMEGVGEFFVSGELGADGGGNVDGTTFERQAGGVSYLGFVKRVFNAGDPSVNHLVIVEERPGLVHTFPINTNDDYDQISGLAGSTRLYYLLYAGDGGSYIDDGATQKLMHAFLDVLGPRWLSASPTEGVVPAGGAAAAHLTFDATGLNGGDYDAQVVVTSDDPDEPEVSVPTHLHVTGAPDVDVTPTALDFGAVFVGASATRTVSVANAGTDVLTVTSIAIDQGDFSADASSFTLAVRETRNVTVTYAPSAPGLAQATLTVQSDDPDEPQLAVSLGGEGLIPPDISVTPSSFSESLFTGESVTRTLTIENTGGSDLPYEISIRAIDGSVSVSARALAASRSTVDRSSDGASALLRRNLIRGDVSLPGPEVRTYGAAPRILVYADDALSGPGQHFVDRALQALGLSYVAYYDDPTGFGAALTGSSWDLVIVDNSSFYALGQWWGALESYLLAGGRALISTFDMDGSDSPPTTLWATLGIAPAGDITFLPSPVYQWDPGHRLFNVPESVPDFTQLVNVYFDHGDRVSVTSPSRAVAGFTPSDEAGYGAIVVAGSGRAIVNSFLVAENLSDLDGDGKPDAVELFENEISYLAGPPWLSASPDSGVVPAGGRVEVSVTIDATGLNGGDYDAQVVVTSNDPDEPEVSVPAHLRVTGAPDIDVTPTALDFGSVFVGASATRTVSVANVGTDVLTVTSVAIDPGDFSADTSSFTLAVGETRNVTVTYTPIAPGLGRATLTLQSDDPDEPQLTVSIGGEGLIPPDISVTPSSFSESLFTGESVTRTLTIENTGGSDLPFEVGVGPASSVVNATSRRGERLRFPSLKGSRLDPGAPAPVRYDAGRAPARQAIVSDRAPGRNATAGSFDVLILHSGDNPSEIQALLESFPDISTVDTYDTSFGVPTLAELAPYRSVIVANGLVFVDPVGTGDVLADYVDAGGGVVLTLASFVGQWSLAGRFVSDGYMPFDQGSGPGGAAFLGPFNASHPIMTGVTSAGGDLLAFAALTPGAELVAAWDNGFPFVATKGPRVAAVNVFVAQPGYWLGDIPLILHNAALWGAGPRWLSASPDSGVVPAGGRVEVSVTIDATGLNGGDYDAQVVVTSNDPDEPEVSVPAHLHVTGAPDIDLTPTALDFGTLFVGASATRTVSVANVGTDVLTVTSIAIDPGDFSADASSFALAVGETRSVTVTFAPSAPGLAQATLTLQSDDPDEPQLTVSLRGEGLIPPDISVAPSSFSESLFTGETVTRTLTIENTGGSDLPFEVGVGPASSIVNAASRRGERLRFPSLKGSRLDPGAPAPVRYDAGRAPARQPIVADQEPGRNAASGSFDVLILQSGGNPSEIKALLEAFPDISTVDAYDTGVGVPTLAQLAPYRSVIVANDSPFVDPVGVGNVLADYVDAGGGVVLTLASFVGQWSLAGRFVTDGYMPFDQGSGPAGAAYLGPFNASHPIMTGVTSAWGDLLAYAALTPGAELVAAWDNGFPFVATKGPRVAAVNVFVAQPGFWLGDIPLILHNAALWGAGPRWLSASPVSGVVPAGGRVEVAVTIDATGLNGGDYDAQVVVTSNDPDEPEVSVPAHLHVTGAPDIDVTPTALDFGSVFVGASATRTVSVANVGTDVLTVTSIAIDQGDFSADASGFTLAVGETRNVTVTYAPSAPGLGQATLTVQSDDPDEPQLTVSLGGEGLIPPDISVTPSSFSESLFTGESVTRTLTIENTGGSDLPYEISIRAIDGSVAVSARALATPRPAVDRSSGGTSALNVTRGDVPPPGPEIRTYGVAPRILVYADDFYSFPGEHFVDRALQALGLPYLAYYSDPAGFGTALTDRSWDLVVIDNNSNPLGDLWGPLESYLLAGGRVLISTYDIDGSSTPPTTLWATLGIAPAGDIGFPSPVYRWDPGHRLFNVPESVPDFTQMFDLYTDDGDRVSVASPSKAVAGFTPSGEAGYGAIVVAGSGRAIVNTFLVVENTSDLDGDAKPDAVELFENEISYLLGPPWLSASPESGVVPAGGRVEVSVTIDATGLTGGDYDARVVVASNDPDELEVSVPAHLHVTGAPDIDVTPTALDFGSVFVGVSATRTVSVANVGTDVLTVTSVAIDPGDFSADASSFTLAVGETRNVTVTFAPSAPGLAQATLTLQSDDPDEPQLAMSLGGEGLIAPDISVTPSSFSESLFTGETVTRTLTIENTGGSNLTFDVGVGPAGSVVNAASRRGERLRFPSLKGSRIDPGAPAPVRYDAGKVPARQTIVSDRAPGRNATAGSFDVLILHSGDNPSEIQALLESFPDISTVDTYDTSFGVPTLAELAPYRSVIVANGFVFVDPVGTGDVLADYVDAGGGVVLTLASFVGQWSLSGRFVTDGYMPFDQGSGPAGPAFLGPFNASHPIMAGVTSAWGDLLAYAALTPGAELVAAWDNGFPFVATQGPRVAAVNVFVAQPGFWLGDIPLILHNAALWGAAPRWLSSSPVSGVVPAGGRVEVSVTFDATGLDAGDYDAEVVVTSNDPDESRVPVHAHLRVPCDGTGFGCAPLAVCHDITVAADTHCIGHATAEQVGAGSRDPSGRPLIYSLQPAGPFGLGATSVTLSVTDEDGESSTCSAVVTVVDVSPPELSVRLTPERLWPPNHRMVSVDALVTAHDNCGAASVVLTSVMSSEADDGVGDGETINDVQQAVTGTPDFSFLLRAERAAGGPGRIYTAVYTATDGAGSASVAAGFALVPHDQGVVADPLVIRLEQHGRGTVVRWNGLPGAPYYNVIRGRLAAIRQTSIVIDLGSVTCVERHSADASTLGREDSVAPGPGEAFFYLVESYDGTSRSYGTATTGKPRATGPGACN